MSFVALAAWPALAGRPEAPAALRRPVAVAGSTGLAVLVGWFFVELLADTGRVGVSERVAAGAQAVWPLVTVLTVRHAIGQARRHTIGRRAR